jgi:hypothetical protein
MTSNPMTSNSRRCFVAEAQMLGSTATTRRGAIRYLIDQFYRPTYGRQIIKVRRGSRIQGQAPWTLTKWQRPDYTDADAWKIAQARRRATPEARRARHDAAFRRKFLARLRREEKRLVADPGANPETAYSRLQQISLCRAIATGRPVTMVPKRAWMTHGEIRDRVHTLALCAGLEDDWNGSSYCDGRGDHFCLTVKDAAQAPFYHAAPGTVIGLVEQKRRRIYAKRSDYRMCGRSDYFVVGENENGTAFLHQIPHTVGGSLTEAMGWIWQGAEIVARQGDIGIAPSSLKTVDGEEMDIALGRGHSRHRFIGEVYVNGAVHVRSGFLVHTANQHPSIYLDASCWRRIVIGRRSERRMSTSD